MSDGSIAVDRLRSALWNARPGEGWLTEDLVVFDVVQGSIVRWVDDLGRSLERLIQAIRQARAENDVSAVEDALIQAVSARDKLRAVAVRVFGAKSLTLYKSGVRFSPSESDLRRVLSDLGEAGIVPAGRTKSLFEELADHPAVALRNEIIHALTPFPELSDVCWVKVANLDDRGGIVSWQRQVLYAEGSLDQGNALPETLYEWAISNAEGAFELLVDTTTALAELVENVGTISPLPECYVWPDGRAQLDDPRRATAAP
jgi:hypothetical protein